MARPQQHPPTPLQTPTPDVARVWFLTSGLSALSVRLTRELLEHGNLVVVALRPIDFDQEGDHELSREFRELIAECQTGKKLDEGWNDRLLCIHCEGRAIGQCGAAIAEAVHFFERIDILLCCTLEGVPISHFQQPRSYSCDDFLGDFRLTRFLFFSVAAVIGTVEELNQSDDTQNLVRDQFETTFFSQVNFIKATLPHLREKSKGHIIILSNTGGHFSYPGTSMFCAATRALEGYCDSLAYETAPFNIKVSIVQASQEVMFLTNKIKVSPQLPPGENGHNSMTGVREILTNILNSHPRTAINETMRKSGTIITRYPILSDEARSTLVMETIFALLAIGGHENPPVRHIVGHESCALVKEKLKNMSEELEDYVNVGSAVDVYHGDTAPSSLTRETPERNLEMGDYDSAA
ncbi:putative short chain dehydrogenase reductase family protein [Golovinomyces cichoracearum]|uniref:Putative short chain dehydrogenase reductase family protein n=1 Tax=Golovinomyces cichoracearum TaxID=62708 RepID=A0A420J911_9PEZI|nr:putative short chain dehydrogenase reductase family protein [Golovinomyces cichoracearum]